MNEKPFLIDAAVGNSRLLATLTRTGEFQRVFWPHVDGPQLVHRLIGGVSVGGAPVVWQDDSEWEHTQAYERDQNVLVTRSRLGALALVAVDAALPGRDVLVRRLTFTNDSTAPVDVRYALYQWIRFDENPLYNTALFDAASDTLVHFRKGSFLAMGADRPLSDVAVGQPAGVLRDATSLRFGGGAVLHGDVAGAAVWELGTLAPGQTVVLSLFWALSGSIGQVRELLGQVRATGAEALLAQTRAYWRNWLSRARPLGVTAAGARAPYLPGIPADPATPGQVEELYRRSLLVFKLMADEQTGAVIAAPEFDPAYTACGGYAYCWGRDAAYITVAMDLAGYHDLAGAFYRWAVGVQEPEGWWMHRHYATGAWGPSWGLIQVDETGSILYGMALHARLHGRNAFIRTVWESVARAADWLVGNMDPETGLPLPSTDLWEERTSELTYSAGAVYAGLQAAAEMAEAVGEGARAGGWLAAAAALKEAILRECVRDGRFLRGRRLQAAHGPLRRTGPKGHPIFEVDEDPTADASLLGMATPFQVVPYDAPVMIRTAEHLVDTCWNGGLRRYDDDHYRGGNPWVLTTLWLGHFEAERGEREKARQLLDWAVARRSSTGLLAEQVDPVTGAPVWVVPLTWSHAMYVLLALKLF
ncbi:MAG TPA: glycoside hydrolase family 15 protein [Symbiobacteriaceae bacterium]|nr:glycoside hydrolase family 15 protein [Symbiobacteriaceae bacterium]